MPKVKSYTEITNMTACGALSEEENIVMLRVQLPHSLMQEITKFQAKMHLYHSVGAIRYLLHRGLMWEECLEQNKHL